MLRINDKLYTDAHTDEPKTWESVGSQEHVIEVLKDLAEFLGM